MFHWQPRLSINQGVCMLSPGFYHLDTYATIFLVVQTFSPTQPYMMNALFPFDLICKWSEVSMQCPPATNLVIITPEMSTVLCVGWSLFFQISPFKGLLERASTFTYSRGRWGSKRENESPEPSQDETSCPGFWLHSSSLHGRKRRFNQFQAFSLDQQKTGHCRPRTKMWYLGQRGRTLFPGPQGSSQATEPQKHSDHLHGHPGLDLPGLSWLQMSRGWLGPLTLCPWKLPFCSPVSLQSHWLVPFLLPFHPFLFISSASVLMLSLPQRLVAVTRFSLLPLCLALLHEALLLSRLCVSASSF